jgi:hypothetical protein
MMKVNGGPRSKYWTLKVEEVIHHEIGADTQELETMLLRGISGRQISKHSLMSYSPAIL